MNNFKKVGFSALAGSLVATSAMAGEISVAGSAGMYLEHINGGAANSGKSFSMDNQLTFTGGGELDNGLNVSVSFESTKVMILLHLLVLLIVLVVVLRLTVTL